MTNSTAAELLRLDDCRLFNRNADTASMDELMLDTFIHHSEGRLLLQAYAELSAFGDSSRVTLIPPVIVDTSPKWFSRIGHLAGVTATHLTEIHGELIALGYLHIQFDESGSELVYRISSEGKRLLKQGLATKCQNDAADTYADGNISVEETYEQFQS